MSTSWNAPLPQNVINKARIIPVVRREGEGNTLPGLLLTEGHFLCKVIKEFSSFHSVLGEKRTWMDWSRTENKMDWIKTNCGNSVDQSVNHYL